MWLITTHNGYTDSTGNKVDRIKIEDYPAIKNHLDQYWKKIEKRSDKGATPYNLRNCAYMRDFYKQKIVWQRITQEPTFCISKEGQLILDSMAFLVSSDKNLDKYLLSILNSKLVAYWVDKNVHQYGNTGYRLSNQYVAQIPIPQIPKPKQAEFETLVDKILANKEKGICTIAEEQQINNLVFDLYGLTPNEITHIENQLSNH